MPSPVIMERNMDIRELESAKTVQSRSSQAALMSAATALAFRRVSSSSST